MGVGKGSRGCDAKSLDSFFETDLNWKLKINASSSLNHVGSY